jgi:hypothetical protein
MNLETIKEVQSSAHAKWREYRNAEKIHKGNKMYTELKKLYWNIKHGKSLFDIQAVIKNGGMHSNWHPRLAICQANEKIVKCTRRHDGYVQYKGKDASWTEKKSVVELPAGTLKPWPREGNIYAQNLEATAADDTTELHASHAYRRSLHSVGSG